MSLPHFLVQFDRAAFLALNHGMKSSALDTLMPALTDIGLGYIQAIAVVITAIYLEVKTGEIHWDSSLKSIPRAIRTHRSWVGPLLAAVAIGGLGAGIIKQAIPGDRPWWYYDNEHKARRQLNVEVYTVKGTYPLKVRRFPSGHTTTSVAVAMVVSILWRRRRVGLWVAITLWIMAVIVALSRIYLASHWPLDILGGTVLGLVSGVLAVKLCDRWARRRVMNEMVEDEHRERTDSASATPICIPRAVIS
jgi:membrane-associated phospholipid phosphatase